MGMLEWLAFTSILLASGGILLQRSWRWTLGMLALQYLGFFWLVHASWSLPLSAVKLVTGWMVCFALSIAQLNASSKGPAQGPGSQNWFFRLALASLAVIVTYAGSLGLADWLGMSTPVAWGGLLLIGMGLLQAGITMHPFHVIVGLLTLLSGFEIIYAAVESSAMVTGLLSLVNLGLALAGTYFLVSRGEEAER